MPIFKLDSVGTLKRLNVLPLDRERRLQQLIEGNLLETLDLQFLATEYPTTFGGRIDTLAVDAAGSPVIIEYKRNRNDNVINQALSYLKWLKTQKVGFFEKLVLDKLGAQAASKLAIDWKSPRVICIAESYSKFDLDTVEVIPLRIELFRYRYYTEGLFTLEPVNIDAGETAPRAEPESGARESANPAPKSPTTAMTLNDHLQRVPEKVRELFGALREQIIALDEDIVERVTGSYIAFRRTKNFAEVHLYKSNLRILLRKKDYEDPRGLITLLPDSFNWTLDRRVYLDSLEDLADVMVLVEQSYRDVL